MIYEIIKAQTAEEALQRSKWQVGDAARCIDVLVSSAGNDRYTIIPSFEPVGKEDAGDQLGKPDKAKGRPQDPINGDTPVPHYIKHAVR